jgi:hypothetical protein
MDSKKMELMIQQITMGVQKDETTLIKNEEESATWDRLEIEIAEIKAKGWIVDIASDLPDVDPVTR